MKPLYLAAVLLLSGCAGRPFRHISANLDRPILLVGDSISYRWYLYGLPANIGVDATEGDTSAQIEWRLGQDLRRFHPQTVIFFAGTNDAVHGITPPQFMRQVRAAVSVTHGHIILCTIPPISRSAPIGSFAQRLRFAIPRHLGLTKDHNDAESRVEAYNAALRAFAVENHLPLMHFNSAIGLAGGTTLLVDGVHPGPVAYSIMDKELSLYRQ